MYQTNAQQTMAAHSITIKLILLWLWEPLVSLHITHSPHHPFSTSPILHITHSPHHPVSTSPSLHITKSPHHPVSTSPSLLFCLKSLSLQAREEIRGDSIIERREPKEELRRLWRSVRPFDSNNVSAIMDSTRNMIQ